MTPFAAFAMVDQSQAETETNVSKLQIDLVPCLSDNYAYLVHEPEEGITAVVDPSESGPVLAALKAKGLKLDFILNTHHHFDHIGGNEALKAEYGATIIGPKADEERIPLIDIALSDGETLNLGTETGTVLDVPGHTKGHIAFWFGSSDAVFTGDTLFALGCGRMFEGTPPQFWNSLSKLADLPDETLIYCGHEYTQSNARFAVTVEPGNEALISRAAEIDRLRAAGTPTIPSSMGLERETNPFLRPMSPNLQATIGKKGADVVEVFAATRKLKDSF